MSIKVPKLPLTNVEKKCLRNHKMFLKDIHKQKPEELCDLLGVSFERSKYIHALAVFQQIPSIGIQFAEIFVHDLQIYSLNQVREQNQAELFDLLEVKNNKQMDPCVEDQFRCVVHYANNPYSEKQCFDFTEERKQYGLINVYSKTRSKQNK